MLSWFKRDPKKRLRKEIDTLYEKSVAAQRSGNLRLYGEIMTKIDKLSKDLNEPPAKKS